MSIRIISSGSIEGPPMSLLPKTGRRRPAKRETAPTFDIYMILESGLFASFVWTFAKAAAFTLGVYYVTH